MSPTAQTETKHHKWKFARTGGVNQVVFRNGADIAHLDELDQKLWMALGMPTRGIEFDPRTADLLDADGDGRIRPPEVLAAVRWAREAFVNLDDVLKGGDSVAISAIKDPDLQAGARRILANLGKPDATVITMADVTNQEQIFVNTRFNGDGVVPVEAAADEPTRQALADIIATLGPVTDRSGQPGVNQANLDAFFSQAEALVAWADQAAGKPEIAPLGLEATTAAVEAMKAVQGKITDYFARCRLAAFDPRAQAALNREESEYIAMAAKDLTITSQEIAVFPLARIEAGKPLPLAEGLNPAWTEAMAVFVARVVTPLLGAGKTALTEAEWTALRAKLQPNEIWQAGKPATALESLGLARVRELLAGPARENIARLIQEDAALEKENAQLAAVEKLVRFQRDLKELLTNYVNFSDFYGRTWAVFQAGTLYLDARACNLCLEVTDAGRHAALAGLSGAFLAYCDISRPGGEKKSIVAVFTDGDSDNLMVGRNGVFYDRSGRDWDATITKIISNPISVREAFWLPYKKLIRFIEEQVAKRAQAASEATTAKMSETAENVANIDKTVTAPKPAEPPRKLDLGSIALIGTAIGGVSALVGGFLQSIFGLGIWLPLGVVGVVLLISGPSMLLAWLKLRQRNLGPILDANGWAINTRAVMNVPFGAALTEMAVLPPGAERSLVDPYAERKRPWRTYVIVAAILVLSYMWWIGRLDPYLPEIARKANVFSAVKAVPTQVGAALPK